MADQEASHAPRRPRCSSTTRCAERCASSCRGGRRTPSPPSSPRCPATPARSAAQMGENIETRGADGAGRLPQAGRRRRDADPSTPLGPTLEGAYALGRGEARNGRSMDALLAAYRVGARVAWRELAATAVRRPGCRAARRSRVRRAGVRLHRRAVRRQRRRPHRRAGDQRAGPASATCERLGQHLLAGAAEDVLDAARRAGRLDAADDADRGAAARRRRCAACSPCSRRAPCRRPRTCPGSSRRRSRRAAAGAGRARGRRRHLLRVLAGDGAVRRSGPSVVAVRARRTTGRSHRCARRAATADGTVLDSEDHLAELVVHADPEALADLRARVLAPLAELRPATAERLDRDAALLAAAPGPPRRRRRRAARARADGALPDGPAARAVRRPARRPRARCST